MLDPALDLWSNPTGENIQNGCLGDSGWALALVTGLRETTLALDEIARITRVGDRQARRIVDRLVEQCWARRVKEGRRVLVVVDFSYLDTEEGESDYLKIARKARKSLLKELEGKALERLGTRTGRMIRDLWRDRVCELKKLKEWAEYTGSHIWDRLIKILSRKSRAEDRRSGLTRWEAERALYEDLRPYLREEPALTA